MRIIYDVVLFLYNASIGIASFFGNRKAKLWFDGRKDWEQQIQNAVKSSGRKCVWFHCASLGEFEQGRPLIEKLKSDDNSLFIVLSFFSPSGYELRKNYKDADVVCYLPADSKTNAKKFIATISPTYVIFIKYEFWLHYFEELHRINCPLYIVSAIFRPSQVFFKWYGLFYRKILKNINHFFVQDNNSARLLSEIGFTNVTISGDTRFDRVYKIINEKRNNSIIEKFRQKNRLIIAGSSWPEDEEIFLPSINKLNINDLKIIIAPHEVSESRIVKLIDKIKVYYNQEKIVRYSSPVNLENAVVLIIDNIGILSSIYGYGTLAWIGGGFGKGIHNILEATACGMPVLIGPNSEKFKEAEDLIRIGGAFTVRNISDASGILKEILNDENKLNHISQITSEYVCSQIGATDKILTAIREKDLILK